MSALNVIYDRISQQITPVVGYALSILFAILAYGALQMLNDRADLVGDKRDSALADYVLLTNLEADKIWSDRLTIAVAARTGLYDEDWQGETAGEVAANLEQSLRNILLPLMVASRSGLQINVDPESEDVPGGQSRLTFEISTQIDRDRVNDFILAIGLHSPAIWIDTLDVNFRRAGPSVNLNLVGHVLIAPPSPN